MPRKHFASVLIPVLLCETPPIYFGDMLSFGVAPIYDSTTSKLFGDTTMTEALAAWVPRALS
ncbi:MAG: hypothetical protein WCA28_22285, partial [Bradyrhizobium sp.]